VTVKEVMVKMDAAGAATICIDRSLHTAELDALILDLAEVRSRLQPPVAKSPGSGANEAATGEDAASLNFVARTAGDGSCEFSIRHPGFGWVACTIPLLALVDLFKRAVSNQDEGPLQFTWDATLSHGEDD